MCRLLLIDDDGVMAMLLRRYLNGHTLDWARTSEDARARLVETEYDLVIVDGRLSGRNGKAQDGPAFVASLKKRPRLVGLTGYEPYVNKFAALNVPAIRKELDIREIAQCVLDYLSVPVLA